MRTRFVVVVLLVCAPLFGAEGPALRFDPARWDFGMVLQGEIAHGQVSVTNSGPADSEVVFVPTCACLEVSPASRSLAPGARGTFTLRYDSADDTGVVRRGFIVRAGPTGAVPLYYLVEGVVRAERPVTEAPAEGPAATGGAAAHGVSSPPGPPVPVDYYYTPGCRSCEEFLAGVLPGLAAARSLSLSVRRVDLLGAPGYEELTRLVQSRGETLRAAPALRVDGVLLQGEAEIRDALPALLDAVKAMPPGREAGQRGPGAPTAAAGVPSTAAVSLAAIPVAAAGLLDGINPCAFTTIIFLLASLALAGRGRIEILVIGAAFSLSVFLSYFAIGLGLFAALRAAAGVPVVSQVLRWVLVVALAGCAVLSVRDYALIRAGRPGDMVLQLPTALKRRIHESIRTRVRAVAIAGSSLVLGFLVSIFEFACTGQVYLPTLAWLARTGDRPRAIGLLLLYNLAFVAPLLVVFGASWAGVGSAGLARLFRAHAGKVKLGLAAVFAGLAALTLVA